MTPRGPTDSPTNVEVVTFVLAELQEGKPVHLERIAVRAYELAPGPFRWDLDKFADLIDKDKVRVSLTDAEKPNKGALVESVGSRRKGQSKKTDFWRLTSAGTKWIQDNEGRLRVALSVSTPRFKRGRADALRRRLEESALFGEFRSAQRVSTDPYAFTDLLECSPDAANSVVARRLDDLRAQTQMLDDSELMAFLDACAHAHADMLEGS